MATAIVVDNNNTYAEERERLAVMLVSHGEQGDSLDEATVARRKSIARKLLEVERLYSKDGSQQYYGYTNYELDQIKEAARTGRPIKLDTHRMHVGTYARTVYVWPGLPILLTLLGGWLFFMYGASVLRSNRFGDLPWKKPWPWIITILGGPVWWLVVPASVWRGRNDPLPVRFAPVTPAGATTTTSGWANHPIRIDLLRTAYTALRKDGFKKYRLRRLAQIDDEITETKDQIGELSQKMRQEREQVSGLEAEKRRVTADIEAGHAEIAPAVIDREIELIATLPGVVGVDVVGDRIDVIVRSICNYADAYYYIGDFRVSFDASTTEPNARKVKDGMLPGWDGGYPVYGSATAFCFGERFYTIADHYRKAQYYEALAITIDCLRSVNESHRRYIPQAFRRLTEEEAEELDIK